MNDDKLINTIKEDCKLWEKKNNANSLLESYLYLNADSDSDVSGFYQLILNGHELWYGSLMEINAIVKSMIVRLEHDDFLED